MNKEEKCKELLEKIKQTPDNIIEEAIDSLSEKMNKEEIEKAKKILLKEDRFYDDETEIKTTKVLLKYIQELEQKESILDKVTDKLKEDIENDYCIKEYTRNEYGITGTTSYSVKPYARELLKFIEGEKNERK